ncbi:MAG: hypothetical protein QOH63_3123 [Acidobacteriota bacterium]|jgi:hypothetical protein|nr:hypothetical protein [Acidobacteriota bacterium]
MGSDSGFIPPGTFISHLQKCGFKKHGPVTNVNDFEVHNLDLTSLKLDMGLLTPLLTSKQLASRAVVTSDHLGPLLPELEVVAQSLPNKFVVLVVGGKLLQIEKGIIEDLGLNGIAIIDRTAIDAVCAANEPIKSTLLSAALVRFLGRESLSPYVSGRPAIGGRFFGRSSVLKRVLPSKVSLTIVGNRRIGKTSLLKEIKERLKLQNVRTAEVYGATCGSTKDVVYKILQGLDLFRDAQHILSDQQPVKNLPSYVQNILDTERRSVAVFIDELDHILDFDVKQNYEVLHLLRSTFDGHDSCRIFLAGFRKVMELKQSVNAPLFNFTTIVELPLFTREETSEMVKRPLMHLGIDVSNTGLPEAIYKDTGGHPELIQIHCAEIVRFMETRGRVPSGEDLLANVFNTEEYKQKVLGTFLANTNPYEELLCYLLMEDAERIGQADQYEFGTQDVDRVLNFTKINLGIREINDIITNLKVSGVIALVTGRMDKYRFSSPQLVNYCVSLKLEFCIKKTLERIKDCPEKIRTLYSEPEEADTSRWTFIN